MFLLLLFQLALIERNMQTVSECMSMAGSLIEHFSGAVAHKESLKVFFLVLQVCHYLMAGQVSGSDKKKRKKDFE